MRTLLRNVVLLRGGTAVPADVCIEDEQILAIYTGAAQRPSSTAFDTAEDLHGLYLSHGFIDLHVHGGGGYDFMDNTLQAYHGATQLHLRHGTTALMPTTVAADVNALHAAAGAYAQAAQADDIPCRLLGLHLEGPYLSSGQAGALRPDQLREPDPAEYEAILERHLCIKRWTIAPERPGALALGDKLAALGILPSAGHSDATLYQMREALGHGFGLLTHLYSAMSTITRRQGSRYPGLVESAYLLDGLCSELIADGKHLPAELLQMAFRFIGPQRLCLVTDAMRGAGMPDGPSLLGGLEDGTPVLIEDGVAKLPDKSAFAGSVATADRLVRNMVRLGGATLAQAVQMMTETPARVLGLQDTTGFLLPGRWADLVLFDKDVNIYGVCVGGRWMQPLSNR